jgi:hypothetical protein
VTVEASDRVGCLGFGSVLDEGEAARPAGFAIGTNVDANDASCRGEKVRELLLGRAEAQIADKNLGRNNYLLWVRVLGLCVWVMASGRAPYSGWTLSMPIGGRYREIARV